MRDIIETILHRRSIRRFDPDRQVEEAALQQILQAGLFAPSPGDPHPTPKPRREGRVLRF